MILDDDSLLTIDGPSACVSRDDGRSWNTWPLFPDSPAKPSWEFGLLKTARGVIILTYKDEATRRWEWNNETHEPIPDARIEVWTTRSVDQGRTWSPPQRLFDGYCGAICDMIQTSRGNVIVPVQRLLYDPGRHAQVTYVSNDEGASWRRSNVIDFGGHGHHDGAFEGTLVELRDGRIWMLLRTNLDKFWQAWSEDDGLSWRVLQPSEIDASSAPGYVTRLAGGRLAMAWNRLYPEGLTEEEQDRYPRRGGDCNYCETVTSWQRKELSIALSEDDGRTWTPPEVLMRHPSQGIAYPFILERRPGLLWVTSRFPKRVGVSLHEEDFTH